MERYYRKKIQEEQLKASEEKFRTYFEHSPYAIVLINEKGKILHVNNEFYNLTKYSKEDLEILYTVDLVFPEDKAKGLARLNKVNKEGYVREEVKMKQKTGEPYLY